MRMNKDGLFKIMQITDMQEIPKVSPDTMALLDAAIEDEKPDLVVYAAIPMIVKTIGIIAAIIILIILLAKFL